MTQTVRGRGEWVGTHRWICVRLMEMLARWVPTTPEMELKVLFGRHVWDCAQHADALGRRAFELRLPLHYSVPAARPHGALLQEIEALESSADRVAGFYDAVLPALARYYRAYLAGTDRLMDEPTVRILERMLADQPRMLEDRARLAAGLSPARFDAAGWARREQALASAVADPEPARRAAGAGA